jgi:hypothetical protein
LRDCSARVYHAFTFLRCWSGKRKQPLRASLLKRLSWKPAPVAARCYMQQDTPLDRAASTSNPQDTGSGFVFCAAGCGVVIAARAPRPCCRCRAERRRAYDRARKQGRR